MHSYTSSSEQDPVTERRYRRASGLFVLCLVALVAVAETGTRAFIHDVSNLLRRMRQESRAAAGLAPSPATPHPLLLVGNSLLVAGVDPPVLDSLLRPRHSVTRFAVEQTTYLDWYFGARRLIGGGARPDVIVLTFEQRHLLGRTVRDEIFAHYLMAPGDLLSVAHAVDLSPTATSELFFANVSDFWGLRKEIRKNLLGRLIPSLPALTGLMTRGSPAPPVDTMSLLTQGAERLRALRAYGDRHGVRFVLALTPPLSARDADFMRRLGDANGISVLGPLDDTKLMPGDYDRDGYHLSEQGRVRYTAALASAIQAALAAPGAGTP